MTHHNQTGIRGWIHRNIYLRITQPLLDRLNLPNTRIVPLVSVTVGYKTVGHKTQPGGWGARISFGRSECMSLFYNGVFFARAMLPFFVGLHFRWRGTGKGKEFLQTYIGWKLNGQFGITFRIQSDASAAAGTTSPNYGQAIKWNDGRK